MTSARAWGVVFGVVMIGAGYGLADLALAPTDDPTTAPSAWDECVAGMVVHFEDGGDTHWTAGDDCE